MLVGLQPLSQYKRKDLYKYVESFELADPSFFEDAVITENLSICTLKKNIVDRYTWQDLVLASYEPLYMPFYEYNKTNNRNIVMTRKDGQAKERFNIDTDFIECGRLFAAAGGAGFGAGGFGYKYNTFIESDEWAFCIGCIHFQNKSSKENFTKYWYNGKKGESLSSKVALGLHITNANGSGLFIPQIDWSNIHINQKELWDKGDYDNAVLAEMGLKFNEDKTVIIKDE